MQHNVQAFDKCSVIEHAQPHSERHVRVKSIPHRKIHWVKKQEKWAGCAAPWLGSECIDHSECAEVEPYQGLTNSNTCWRAEHKTEMYFILLTLLSFPLDCAGGLRWLRLWEQAACSYSFSACVGEACSPTLTKFYLHLRKNWKKQSLKSHNAILGTYVSMFYLFECIYFYFLSQCIILKCVHYIQLVFYGWRVTRCF